MKTIIWMEMVLIGGSILIFSSVWMFLDRMEWASGGAGLTVLLVAGVILTAFALHHIQKPSDKKGEVKKVG